jgi:hypothetical protein
VMDVFKTGAQELFAWGWLKTTVLISASSVAKITGVSHQRTAQYFLIVFFLFLRQGLIMKPQLVSNLIFLPPLPKCWDLQTCTTTSDLKAFWASIWHHKWKILYLTPCGIGHS